MKVAVLFSSFLANEPDMGMLNNDTSQLDPLIATYCMGGKGTNTSGSTRVSIQEKFSCDLGYQPRYYFEAWTSKNPALAEQKKIPPELLKNLDPSPYNDRTFKLMIDTLLWRTKHPDDKCHIRLTRGKYNRECLINGKKQVMEDVTEKMVTYQILRPDFGDEYVNGYFEDGKEEFLKAQPKVEENNKIKVPVIPTVITTVAPKEIEVPTVIATETENPIVTPAVTEVPTVPATTEIPTEIPAVAPEPEPAPAPAPAPTPTVPPTDKDEEGPAAEENTDDKAAAENVEDPACKDQLKQAISTLLEDDSKNIIGLQYELTVLKMAAAAKGVNSKTLEGLIRKQSKEIAKNDEGIRARMKELYLKHGLKQDEQAVYNHLKQKSSQADYFARDKRFFNQESSAFLLAYQHLNANSGIDDADISVLWFMDKASQKAQENFGKGSSQHNRMNLSTRISQYTGATNAKKTITKAELDEMVSKQKVKIEKEFTVLLEDFKKNNPACFEKLFKTENNQCDLNPIQEQFSQLLAISSQIPATDQISLDDHLKGGLSKHRFSIGQYVKD